MSHSEPLVALENIIIDEVAAVPTARNKKIDTSAPMEIGVAAKDDGENLREEGDQRIVEFALEADNGTGKGKWSFRKGQNWDEKGYQGGKVAKMQIREERTHGRRAVARKEAKDKRKEAKGEARACWTSGKTGQFAAWCGKGGNRKLYAIDEDDSENVEETPDNEEWCLVGK